MKPIPTILALIFLSVLLVLANQYWLGSIVPTVVYAVLAVGLILWGALRERRLRADLVARLNALFDGGEADLTAEREESTLARRVVLTRKSQTVREEKLKDGYEHLSSLVSDIAHQSKTPLASIRMTAETLNTPEGEVIRAQSDRLGFLFDALVRLSRCECGLIDGNLSPRENSVEELVCRAVSDALPAAEKRGIDFTADLPDGLTAIFDPRWTAEALFNLCDNAVKYAPENSVVTVTAKDLGTSVRIDVSDRGPGVPESERNEIWKRFHRGTNAVGQPGVGIGLTLTRAIVTAQGGRTLCGNNQVFGAMFSIFLPKSRTVSEVKEFVTRRKD